MTKNDYFYFLDKSLIFFYRFTDLNNLSYWYLIFYLLPLFFYIFSIYLLFLFAIYLLFIACLLAFCLILNGFNSSNFSLSNFSNLIISFSGELSCSIIYYSIYYAISAFSYFISFYLLSFWSPSYISSLITSPPPPISISVFLIVLFNWISCSLLLTFSRIFTIY